MVINGKATEGQMSNTSVPQESLLYKSLLLRISSHGGISVLIPSIQLGFMVLDLAVTDSQLHAGKQTVATVAATCRAHIHPLAVCVSPC